MGRHYSSNLANDRRFFHRPDVVQSKDSLGPFEAVVIGSGNRADPLSAGGLAEDFVYMIKDRNTALNAGTNSTLNHSNIGDVTNTCLQQGSPCTADLSKGWRLSLNSTGEKNLSSALTIGGTVFFSTYLPPGASSSGSCGPDEGNGRFYAIKLANAAAIKNLDTTDEDYERSRESNADGIPSEAVYIPTPTDSESRVMHNDYSFDDAETSSRLRTFWLEAENEDL
jgi:type IV pilus assembly protein PilY1